MSNDQPTLWPENCTCGGSIPAPALHYFNGRPCMGYELPRVSVVPVVPQMTPEQLDETVQMIFEPARVHARRTDPYTSDKALKAIAKDESLMAWIWYFAEVAGEDDQPFNDTWLTEEIEARTGQRQQRNVIARSRGLLVQAGMLRSVGVLTYEGRELVHYEIDPNNNKENSDG